jgi:hypothetical protein
VWPSIGTLQGHCKSGKRQSGVEALRSACSVTMTMMQTTQTIVLPKVAALVLRLIGIREEREKKRRG